MLKTYVNAFSCFLTGGLLITIGILLILMPQSLLSLTYNALYVLFFVMAGISLVQGLINIRTYKKLIDGLTGALTNLAIGLVMCLFPQMFWFLFPFLFALYAFLNAVINWVGYVKLRQDDIKQGRFRAVMYALISFVFGAWLLIANETRWDALCLITAAYAITYGAANLFDGVTQIFPRKIAVKFKQNFRITLPMFWAAFIPRQALAYLNDRLKVEPEQISKRLDVHKTDQTPTVQIIVHVGEKGPMMFGHVDFCMDGVVLSYGAYDPSSRRLFSALGDGVLFSVNREQYIDFCNRHGKTLFVYGLVLTAQEQTAVLAKLQEIRDHLVLYKHNMAACNKLGEEFEPFDDWYLDDLARDTDAVFYKFSCGNFKTYYLFGTNCVKLVDNILGASGINLVAVNGIITPGTYYDYLDRQFTLEGTRVISRTVYPEIAKETPANAQPGPNAAQPPA